MKNPYDVIRIPWVTEKATIEKDEQGTLCFKVLPAANKVEIKHAVETLFSVKVDSVRVMNVRGKLKRYGRYAGKRPNWKKAYVKLKDGSKTVEYFET